MITISFRMVLKLEKLEKAAEKGTRRAQVRSGAVLRSLMRRSIKFRKNKNSDSGSTPFSHVKGSQFGLKSILYDYDPRDRTTIVGPIGGNERTGAPKALEFGGRANIRLTKALKRKLGRSHISATIKRRPFAGPALEAFSTNYPEMFKDVIQ